MTERAMDESGMNAAGMNAGASAMHGIAQDAPGVAPAALHPMQTMYWSVRRELWEHRSIYMAPLAVAGLLVLGVTIAVFGPMHGRMVLSDMDEDRQRQLLAIPFVFATLALMGTGFLVAVFYCLDALYGERRDRSILFWKSLPVSDTTAVVSKAIIPMVAIPLVCFAVTIATQAVMAAIVSVGLVVHGVHGTASVTQLPLVQMSAMLLFHLVAIHGFWYAPIYGWFLLVSAWAKRAPFLWAVLPPLGVCLVEKLAFDTNHFGQMLKIRFQGNGGGIDFKMLTVIAHGMPPMGLGEFLSSPGLWVGLAVAAVMLAGAVQVRRYRGPL
jgi:ABC-2 type transport system permease protein